MATGPAQIKLPAWRSCLWAWDCCMTCLDVYQFKCFINWIISEVFSSVTSPSHWFQTRRDGPSASLFIKTAKKGPEWPTYTSPTIEQLKICLFLLFVGGKRLMLCMCVFSWQQPVFRETGSWVKKQCASINLLELWSIIVYQQQHVEVNYFPDCVKFLKRIQFFFKT